MSDEPKRLPNTISPELRGGERKTLERADLVAARLKVSLRFVRRMVKCGVAAKEHRGALYVDGDAMVLQAGWEHKRAQQDRDTWLQRKGIKSNPPEESQQDDD